MAAHLPFSGRSEMHARVSAQDWAATSVGPIEPWPQSLRATVKTLLGSRYPMILLWGPELVQIYNDAYIGLIGGQAPGRARALHPRDPGRGLGRDRSHDPRGDGDGRRPTGFPAQRCRWSARVPRGVLLQPLLQRGPDDDLWPVAACCACAAR